MNAQQARAKRDAKQKIQREELKKKEAAVVAERRARIKRVIDSAHRAVAARAEDFDFADVDVDSIENDPEAIEEVILDLMDEGFSVEENEREERDYDEPGRAPDVIPYLRLWW